MTGKNGARRRWAPPMGLELIGVLEHRRALFEAKFGRPPRRGEPLFFDPAADRPRRLPPEARRKVMAEVMALVVPLAAAE